MKEPTLGNPQNTIEVLQKYNFVFQKKFGQNFLIDTHVLDKIIAAAEITKDDFVLEIGPGIGTMTQYLACAARKVVAVEIDKALIPILCVQFFCRKLHNIAGRGHTVRDRETDDIASFLHIRAK